MIFPQFHIIENILKEFYDIVIGSNVGFLKIDKNILKKVYWLKTK